MYKDLVRKNPGKGLSVPEGLVAVNETFQNILNSLGSWGLKVLGFLAILIVGWIISRILGRIVDRVLNKVGFNRLAVRTKLRRWTGNYEPSALVGKIVYYAALLFTFQIAFNVFGPNPVSSLISTIISWLPRLLVAAIIVVVAIGIANAVYDIISNALSQLEYGKWLGRAAQVIIIALGLIAALSQIGIAMSVTMPVLIAALATIGGVIVVGVGGGLIQPMRQRWERMLSRAESETTRMTTHLRTQNGKDTTAREPREVLGQPGYRSAAGERDVKPAAGKPAGTPTESPAATSAEQAARHARGQQSGGM